jgi:hypothetical protein
MAQEGLYTVASITRESLAEPVARVAVERSRQATSGAQFVGSGLGPDFSTQHALTWETNPSAQDLPGDVGPDLRLEFTAGTNLGAPASSADLIAALEDALALLDSELHASLVAEVEASDGTAALAAATGA